jgi:hypothetical protein
MTILLDNQIDLFNFESAVLYNADITSADPKKSAD